MKQAEKMDRSLQELIDIIHFTENVSAKIHGLRTEEEIFHTVIQEFAGSKRYAATIMLLTEDGRALTVKESSVGRRVLHAMEKAAGLKLEGFRAELDKSTIFAQVIREGKVIEANGAQILGELVPGALVGVLIKILGLGTQPSLLVPLQRHGKPIGLVAVTSPGFPEAMIPSVRNLAQHISVALEMAEEHASRVRAEQALSESERQLRALIENAPDCILILNADGTVRYVSPSVERAFGYTLEELRNRSALGLVHPDDLSAVTEMIARSMEKPDELVSLRIRVLNKDGSWRNVEFVGKNLIADPAVHGIVVNFRDVTDRKQAEELFSVLSANAPVAMYIAQDGVLRFVNPAFLSITGFSGEEILGKPSLSIVHPEDRERVRERAIRMLKGLDSSGYEFRLLAKDGSERHVYEKVASIEYGGKRAVLGNFVDITAIKKTEEEQQRLLAAFEEQNRIITAANAELEETMQKLEQAHQEIQVHAYEIEAANEELRHTQERLLEVNQRLRESEEKYRNLIENAGTPIIYCDLEGRIILLNDIGAKMLHGGRDDFMGKVLYEVLPEMAEAMRAQIRSVVESGVGNEFENLLERSDGSFWFRSNIQPVRDDSGRITAVQIIAQDITERKRIEQALREREQEYAALVELSPDGIVLMRGSEILFANQRMYQLMEAVDFDWAGKDILELIESWHVPEKVFGSEKGRGMKEEMVADVLANDRPRTVVIPVEKAAGEVGWLEISGNPIEYKGGKARLNFIRDVTERKRAEEQIERLNAILKAIRRIDQLILWEKDPERLIQGACETFTQTRGYSGAWIVLMDKLGRYASSAVAGIDPQAFSSMIERMKKGEWPPCARAAFDTPRPRAVDASASACADDCPLCSRSQQRAIVLRLQYKDDIFGIISIIRPLALESGEEELSLIEEVGGDIAFGLHAIEMEQERAAAEQEIRAQHEEIQVHSHELEVTNEELREAQNKLLEYSEELKQRLDELQAAYEKLKELDKMKDNFLSTVSHELRTPLTSIKSFAEILLNYENDRETEKEFLGIINEEADRLTRLINDVLDISKIEAGRVQWHPVDLSIPDVLESAVNATRALVAQANLTMELTWEPDLPIVWADRDRIIQVVTNLISNAVKFTPAGGHIGIKAERLRSETTEGLEMVKVSVSDTGIGIPPEEHQRIFEKFHQIGDTLKDKPKGTGLGLTICKDIVEHFGGRIWVESEPGKGSTFFFTLPAKSKAEPEAPAAENPAAANVGGGNGQREAQHLPPNPSNAPADDPPANQTGERPYTILVVDDEPNIRRFLGHELTQRGYHVIEAPNGNEAIRMAREHVPDLITLDVLMPDLTGLEVTAILRDAPATRDIPILIISVMENQEQAFKLGANDYLTKPCDVEEVARKVAQLIRRSPGRVLVVDDDKAFVREIQTALEKRGFMVSGAYDGQQGLEAARTGKPDLILLDLLVPKIGGADFIRALKSDPIGARIPIIALSGVDIEGDRVEVLSLGAADYLTKTGDMDRLFKTISTALGNRTRS